MTDETQTKYCPLCSRPVKNLSLHILAAHPEKAAEIEGNSKIQEPPKVPNTQNIQVPNPQPAPKARNIKDLLMDYADQLLTVRVIKALSNNAPDSVILGLQQQEKPQKSALEELKEHLAVMKQLQELMPQQEESTGKTWVDLVAGMLPEIKTIMQERSKAAAAAPAAPANNGIMLDADYEKIIKQKQEELQNEPTSTSTTGSEHDQSIPTTNADQHIDTSGGSEENKGSIDPGSGGNETTAS